MNLYFSTYLFAAMFLALGIAFAFFSRQFKAPAFAFLRSTKAAVITFGGSGLWFLYILSQLGEADFGEIKWAMVAAFGIGGALAFIYLKDFLSVRGLCVLALLLAYEFLDSARFPEPHRVLAALTYAMVLAALYLGALPYRLRDFFEYLYAAALRSKIFGALMILCAFALLGASVFY